MKKRLLSALLAVCMVMTMAPVAFAVDGNGATGSVASWDGTTVDTSWNEEGNAEVYTMQDAADLAGLAQLVNEGNNFSGKTIKLGADIDLSGKEWTPIGTSGKPFSGTFDGNEKTISNLSINTPKKSNVGLFGYTADGEVKNFTLQNAEVAGRLEVGAVAGTPHTSKYTNITVTGLIQVDGYSYVGGALGKSVYANVTNVDVVGDTGSYVRADSENYRTYIGGLVGFMGEGGHTVSDCDVKIDVTGSTCDVGGILGILHYGNTLTNCTYEGNLTLTKPDKDDGAEFGALTGTVMNSSAGNTTITGCSATVNKAMSGDLDVTNTITPHGDFYNDIASGNGGNVSIDATVNGTPVTVDNNVAKIGETGYKTLSDAITAANGTTETEPVTVEITKSGTYAPFTITRENVTVQAADGVDATIKTDKSSKMAVTANNVTLNGLNFVSTDGTAVISGGNCDSLALEKCSFTGNGKTESTALYIHQPNITITGCTFKDFERGYYTCGDNHAAGQMNFANNTFTNVRVPIDGYWGKTATDNTNIQITGNTFDAGNWDTAYIQLWDYAQYLKWAGNENDDRQGSALNATISGNTYRGDVVIYKTHCDWSSKSNVTIEDTGAKVVDRKLIVLENVAEGDKVTVTNADGSPITAFNDSTEMKKVGDKYVIYSLSEGNYKVNVTHKADESGNAIVTSTDLTVEKPVLNETQPLEIPQLTEGAKYVAEIGEKKYTSLAEAIEDAKNGGTVKLLQSVSIGTWTQVWDAKNLTIDGNGKTITVGKVESNGNGDYLFYGAENLNVSNLTINFTTNGNGFSMSSGKLDHVKMYGGENSKYAVFVDSSSNKDAKVEINNCVFENFDAGVYSQPADGENATANIAVNGTEFNDCDYAIVSYAKDTVFTNNKVTGATEVSFAGAAEDANRENTYTITGNEFVNAGKVWFYGADLEQVEFKKNQVLGNTVIDTTEAKDDTKLDVSENYWGGKAPTDAQVDGDAATGKDVYYEEETMNPEDLNTYRPSSSGGSSSSNYSVTANTASNGSVTVSKKYASKGATVKVTTKPDTGYELDKLTVTDKDGKEIKLTNKGSGEFTFEMPASKVTVKATFKKAGESGKNPFTDVSSQDYFYDAVLWAAEKGVTSGVTDTLFAPNASCTRAQMVTFLWRANGSPVVNYAMKFTDVPADAYYAEAVRWAVSKGITSGTTETTFSPDATVTRAQTVSFLYRHAGSPAVSGNSFADVNADAYYANAVAWAVAEEITAGTSTNTFSPNADCTRGQIVSFLYRAQ